MRGGGLCELKSYQPQIALRYSHLCHKSYLESTNYVFTRQSEGGHPGPETSACDWSGVGARARTNQIMSTHFYPGFVSWLVKLAPVALISWHWHPSHHHLHQQHLSIKIEVKLQGREHNNINQPRFKITKDKTLAMRCMANGMFICRYMIQYKVNFWNLMWRLPIGI